MGEGKRAERRAVSIYAASCSKPLTRGCEICRLAEGEGFVLLERDDEQTLPVAIYLVAPPPVHDGQEAMRL